MERCTQSTKERVESDALMPLLFSLGQHASLEAISRRLRPGERLFAYLDDIWFVTKPERVGEVHSLAERDLWREAGIQVHTGKTHDWNRSGIKSPECDAMQRRAVDRFQHVSRASKCLVVLLATTISPPEICRPWVRNTRCCCRRSRQCRTSQRGCCCFALPLVQTISCEFSGLTWCSRSLNITTPTCGSASATFWGSRGWWQRRGQNLSHTPPRSGWAGVEECSTNMRCRSLGKLGGHSAHDRCSTSDRC